MSLSSSSTSLPSLLDAPWPAKGEASIKTRGYAIIENLENLNTILYILVFLSEKLRIWGVHVHPPPPPNTI